MYRKTNGISGVLDFIFYPAVSTGTFLPLSDFKCSFMKNGCSATTLVGVSGVAFIGLAAQSFLKKDNSGNKEQHSK